MSIITHRILTALAAPAVAIGIMLGGIAPGIVAPAIAGTRPCITSGSASVSPNSVNPLTRPAQVNAIQPPTHVWAPPSSCLGS